MSVTTPATSRAEFVAPQLARLVPSAPATDGWLHELKLDGYRLIAVRASGVVTLFTRNGHDWTPRFGPVAGHIAALSRKDFVLDGEAVVFDADGRSSFGALQEALTSSPEAIVFVAFDLLHLGGRDLRALPLRERLKRLASLVSDSTGPVRRSEVWEAGDGPQLLRQACTLGLEGIISKRADGQYQSGSRAQWVKSKCRARQEFVIAGFTPPKGSRTGFGALLLASYEEGRLVPRGKVGTGFTERRIRDLMTTFRARTVKAPLFATRERGVTWLRPDLVAEVEFTEFTRDGAIRHGSFVGMRDDKPAREVHMEKAATTSVPRDAGTTVLGITVTHPERVVFPGAGVTKLDVARHYEHVGPWMLPYVKDRPLAVVRAPDGIDGEQFFQKSFTSHVPAEVKTGTLADGSEIFYITGPGGLVSLAQFGMIEVHPWGSTVAQPDRAEFLTWDLDPDAAVGWKEVLGAALLLRDTLHALDLDPMVKHSGGKGLHIMLRVRRDHTWDVMKQFTKDIARQVAAQNPKRFTIVASKAKRTGKIYIDWLRNGRGATCVAPWALRARAGAPVSMPVSWDALSSVPEGGFTIADAPHTPAAWLDPTAQRIGKSVLVQAAKPSNT